MSTPREERRLLALHDLELLDTAPEERFDRITRAAARALGMTASITLVDRERQWTKSIAGGAGTGSAEIPRSWSFCSVALDEPRPLVVPDARIDPRFAENPLVTGDTGLVFYAGAPVRARDGSAVGTLCIHDSASHTLTEADEVMLVDLARWVELELNVQREREELARMQRRFVALTSHELRTPLTALRGGVEELLDEATTDEEDRRAATEAIARSTTRLGELVEELLLGTRADTADDALALETLDLGRLVDDVILDLHACAAGVVRTTEGEVRVRADRRRLRTAVRALLRDAVAARAGTVSLAVRATDDTAVLELGTRVPPTGIGVALARAVVRLHDGHLELRPGPQDPGVTLALPVAGPARSPLRA